MTLQPRIYVTTDANATVRAIANTAENPYYIAPGDLRISFDGKTFHTVLFNSDRSGPGYYHGAITQPALDINSREINFANGEVIYDGRTYVLDETATIGETITKPVMRVISIVETHLGYYVTAQNYLTGGLHSYLDGKPLTIISGISARCADSDIVEDSKYVGHHYLVRGDHMDVTRQTATFDGVPATQLNAEDYVVTFADDLSTVAVTKKK